MADMADAQAVLDIANEIKPMFVGVPPDITSAVLAELTATWLAGFVCPESIEAGEDFKEQALAGHIELVRKLAAVEAQRRGNVPG